MSCDRRGVIPEIGQGMFLLMPTNGKALLQPYPYRQPEPVPLPSRHGSLVRWNSGRTSVEKKKSTTMKKSVNTDMIHVPGNDACCYYICIYFFHV